MLECIHLKVVDTKEIGCDMAGVSLPQVAHMNGWKVAFDCVD